MGTGILDRRIDETPVAIIDFETTGLAPGFDRVVEVAVVRSEPGCKATLVYETLVDPKRRMSGTEIHGITSDDVQGAPTFEEIAQDLQAAVSGCVVAAYNVYFDMRFFVDELSRCGLEHNTPHFCLMYLRPLLQLGDRCSLQQACKHDQIYHSGSHTAAEDALAAAKVFARYQESLRVQDIHTFKQMAARKNYKFNSSFQHSPLNVQAPGQAWPTKSRVIMAQPAEAPVETVTQVTVQSNVPAPVPAASAEDKALLHRRRALGAYWDSLTCALADLDISDKELRWLQTEQETLGLRPEELRVLHARAVTGALTEYCYDAWLDDDERKKLARLFDCLRKLGWAPGD